MEAIGVVVLQVVAEAAGLNTWVVHLLGTGGQVSGRAGEFLTDFALGWISTPRNLHCPTRFGRNIGWTKKKVCYHADRNALPVLADYAVHTRYALFGQVTYFRYVSRRHSQL